MARLRWPEKRDTLHNARRSRGTQEGVPTERNFSRHVLRLHILVNQEGLTITKHESHLSRRTLLSRCGALTATLSGAGLAGRAFGQAVQPGQSAEKKPADGEEEVSAVEDLMREHGVLARLLLLYEHQLGSSIKGWEFSREAVAATANLRRRFVEDYHEKLEEQHVFTRFTQPGEMAELVKTLRQQHDAGRRVTDAILALASGNAPLEEASRQRIQDLIRQFLRMYWPHLAREDTVLFPAFKEIVPKEEYEKLGDQFEAREEELFGKNGFQNVVEQVTELERRVGIYDLDQFTPRA